MLCTLIFRWLRMSLLLMPRKYLEMFENYAGTICRVLLDSPVSSSVNIELFSSRFSDCRKVITSPVYSHRIDFGGIFRTDLIKNPLMGHFSTVNGGAYPFPTCSTNYSNALSSPQDNLSAV